jgi:hypothetical protein
MRTVLFFTFSSISIFFISCKENICTEKELPSTIFTQSELNMIPYDGEETLIFNSSTEPTITYSGKKRSTETDIICEDPNEYAYSGFKGTYCLSNYSDVTFQAATKQSQGKLTILN